MPTTSPLTYCPHFSAVTQRLRSLYERKAGDQIFAVVDTPNPALDAFAARYQDGYTSYPDPRERFAFWDAYLSRRAEVFDDGVASAYLSECDQGLYGGTVGGKVHYMAHEENGWISSMVPPLLKDLSELDSLKVNTDSEAFRRFREQLDLYVKGAAGRFGISHFILIDSLNFIYELIGATNTYLALFDTPGQVRKAIDFAFELNVMIQETFFASNVMVAGGTCSNMVQWIPGRIVSESVDPFHMTSVDDFERWGREPAERILGRFDGGVAHIHGNGRHLLGAVPTLRGLKAIYLGDDVGFPRAFEVLPDLRKRAGDIPLVLACGYEEFSESLNQHTLTGGVLYKVAQCPDVATANGLMDKVRAYRT
jgi:hypothetical protein